MKLVFVFLVVAFVAFSIVSANADAQEQEELSLTRVVRDAQRRKNGGKAKRGNRKGNRSQKKKQRMMKKVKKAGKRMRMQRKKSAGATKVRSSARQNGKYTGPPCSYIIFENILTNGAGCKTGDKFVLKAETGSRRQFLIISGKVVLAFVSNEAGKKKFTDCTTITDATPSLSCKTVDGVAALEIVEAGTGATVAATTAAGATTAAATTAAGATTAAAATTAAGTSVGSTAASASTAGPTTAAPSTGPTTAPTTASGSETTSSVDCAGGCEFTIKVNQAWSQEPNGYDRTALVKVPATSVTLPVVIDLHGSGGNANTQRLSRFLTNSIIVAPQGYESQWNIVKENSKAPDVAFIGELIKKLAGIKQANMEELTVLGTSNGAGLISRLLIEMKNPRNMKRVIPMVSCMVEQQYNTNSFWMPANQDNTGENIFDKSVVPDSPGPEVIYFHGTEDKTIPYVGGPGLGLSFLGAQTTTFLYAKAFGYAGAQIADNAGTVVETGVTKYEYSGTSKVTHYKMLDMSHNAFDAKYKTFIESFLKTTIEG